MKSTMKSLTIVTLALVLWIGASAQAALVGHWEFDGDMTDSVGTADGVAGGDAAVVGGVAVFDGVGDGITVATTGLGSSTSFTVAIWSLADAGNGGAFLGSGSAGYERFFMRYLGAHPDVTGALNYEVGYSPGYGPDGYFTMQEIPVTGGEWAHTAITWDAGTKTASAYVNGVQSHSQTMDWDFPGFYNDTLVMADNFVDFAGSLDDLRLYDTALSATEVAAIVPEPATMALLGLGGLLLRRRR